MKGRKMIRKCQLAATASGHRQVTTSASASAASRTFPSNMARKARERLHVMSPSSPSLAPVNSSTPTWAMSITGRWLLPWSPLHRGLPPFLSPQPINKKIGSAARHAFRRAGRDRILPGERRHRRLCCHSARRRRIPPRLPRFTDLHKFMYLSV
jgi:hypothetical protein